MRASAWDQAAITVACGELVAAEATHVACLSRAPASGAYRARLTDRRSVIVKLYFGSARWKAAKEQRIIDALTVKGTIRTARLLACGALDTHDASALISSDLGDRTLWRAVDKGECTHREGLALVGRLLSEFHDIGPITTAVGDEARLRPEGMVERLSRQQLSLLRRDPSGWIAPRVEPALRTLVRLSRQPATTVGCHGDLHPANVVMCLCEGGYLAPHLVDFESVVCCVPEYDLAKSMVTSSALGDNERSALLAGYADRRTVSEELLYAFVVFHVVDGWVHAALAERRDQPLWRSRIDEVLARYAPLFRP